MSADRPVTAADIVYRYHVENPQTIPEGYELVTDGTTQEGDIIERTNTGSVVEKVIRQLRKKTDV